MKNFGEKLTPLNGNGNKNFERIIKIFDRTEALSRVRKGMATHVGPCPKF